MAQQRQKAAVDPEEASAIQQLWDRFKASGDEDARERLIIHYSPLVKYVAGRVSVGLPNTIEQADLTSYGIFGLIDAIEKFDPSRNIKFETYAINRIRGAIIDELRAVDWIPRSVRSKAREVERALAVGGRTVQLALELGERPLDLARLGAHAARNPVHG
ncbi:MAG TPA: sigma-70 family RNA polymerase sigma factor, partial [Actinomycetota bacterium]|nr:sigma-70 family RNA polymerase sigma factor [Actinomycetota bacterium]